MSRKNQAVIRDVLPDPIYNSKMITKLINGIMMDGKRGKAQYILYTSFKNIEARTGQKAMDVFNKALDNIMPTIELRVRRVGGANYQVPVEVTERRRRILGLRWLVQYARLREEKTVYDKNRKVVSTNTMVEKLTKEIIDASNGIGQSVKKKEDTHKMAEANKAFAHYRW